MPLGTNTTIAYVSPPLECVICIQSSKQELKNSNVVVETPKEISPLVIVPNVHLRQVSDVSTVMPPSKKTNLPTPTSYVEELWESLNVKKSPLGIVDAKKVDKMGEGQNMWKIWVQGHATMWKTKIFLLWMLMSSMAKAMKRDGKG